MNRFSHASLLTVLLALAPACSSGEASVTAGVAAESEMAVTADLGAEALVEEHDEGSVAWRIDSDGQVKAAVTASTGARLKENVGGALVYKVEGSEPRTVPLVVDAKTGMLVAAGPKLEADLTEVSYTVTVSGKPWSGVLHVPVGGTAALAASAKVTAEAKVPDEAVGPHGGTIQVVGSDRLEMVADADTGETRVYVLDVDLRPVKVEARALRMGFVAKTTTFVDFAPEPAGLYFTARVGTAVLNPLRVTASLRVGGVAHAAIWGYRPGVRIYAPSAVVKVAAAPRVRFSVRGGFDSRIDVYGRPRAAVVITGDDHDRKKGNNGRHVGQDGTWERDSGGFKSDNDRGDPRGGKAKVGGSGDGDHGGSKASASAKIGGGGDKSGGGSSAKSGGGGSKGGGSAKSGGGGDKSGGKGGKK